MFRVSALCRGGVGGEVLCRSAYDSGRMAVVTGLCSVSSAPAIIGNLGHFQPVHM